ncbi:fumarylacetoacetate hydrolase family protein [Phenylobacterium sp.]|uniref:2-keto-4-pentenoate hydratase n=1 Tax=Phenylobacterium sp. TaxID=1871053 RepID=UPI00121D8A44|nr:fumarylacetoacetate hydrolase family protein [Phenylobacterium sp.]THD60658.1 MAG: hydratase [Phenylobacterium sp.]
MTDAQTFAKAIAERHRNRERFTLEAPPGRAGDMAFGYDVQDALVPLLAQPGEAVAGYKIGLTTPRMQQMCAIDEPIVGAVLSRRMHVSPARVAMGGYVRLGVESEIAVRIGASFLGGQVAPEQALDHVDAICAAFELVDDSGADYGRLAAATLVADNAWNAGLVTGPTIAAAGIASLKDRKGVLFCDGEEIDTGSSSDVLGDPANALSWVVRHLARRGQALQPGQWVSTGSIVPTKFVASGQSYRFEVEGLPPVEVTIA